ncbi:putative ATP-dependent RNA helicase TDRD12 [Maniola jurtina]|uniref:putative ATP-dependent RNA helicase TDRD12 n=1 Tax=Maniola jurtina TaxID=191418 RepID=UPI001E6888EB|nr:putative ATP-dependent RNA helicase TDRD12 [Maniola jurtina]
MPHDRYKIEIMHYLNPHLIWVEVCDPSVLKEGFLFEQIGIYGILPMKKTMEFSLTEYPLLNLKSQKCDEWQLAASLDVKELLDTAAEVWFSRTFIDRRFSIFKNDIHKYGEIIIKTQTGEIIEFSKQLIKLGYAEFNVFEFHEKLNCDKLNTKLSTLQTRAVVKELEKYCIWKDRCENLLKESLTVSNLNIHNNEIIQKLHKIIQILKNKPKDDKNIEKAFPDDYFKTKPKSVKNYLVNKRTNKTDSYCKEKTRSKENNNSSNRHQEENIDTFKTSKRFRISNVSSSDTSNIDSSSDVAM